MANKKITELNEATTVSGNDWLVMVDVANDETKKVHANLVGGNIPIQDTPPQDPEDDDLWIDTSEPEEMQEAIKNEYSESTSDTYSCDYTNGKVGVVLFDRTGNEAPNYTYGGGIAGTQSLSLDMSNYKRIEVFGFMNTRKYQFNFKIDITDSLNTFNDDNKYWGRALIMDNILDTNQQPNIYCAECSVSQNKQTFTAENFSFKKSTDGTLNTRNSNSDYVVTKVIGYK